MYPDATQTWYADDAGALGTFDNLEQYFNSGKTNGLAQEYYPKPTKSILIVLAVILGMTNPKEIGSQIGWINGRVIFVFSAKRRRNVLRRVTPRWHVWSNRSGYFCNA